MDYTDKNNSDEKGNKRSLPYYMRVLYTPRFMLGAAMIYLGIGIPYLMNSQQSFFIAFKTYGPAIIGASAALIGIALAFKELDKLKPYKPEKQFIDVDESRFSEHDFITKQLNELKAKANGITDDKIEAIVARVIGDNNVEPENLYCSFESYFNDIRRVLLEQAHISDKKASILLDKGTAYAKAGITFFIISIVVWQALSMITGFKDQYIYGIVSCSLLFIFIEFLSAWFLKQYRHFVDTSTYHIKVKSIFDKYMMSYLAIKSLSGKESCDESKYQAMLKTLEEDIKWPESYLLKTGDISFAKEAFETMTQFAKAVKSDANK
jgi:hypothetical protein